MEENSNELIIDKHVRIKQYLQRKYNYVIQKYQEENSKSIYEESDVIWVCWWQGLENAPEIVKICFEKIKEFAGTKKVVLITKENYKDYVEIPEYIIEKLERGILSITHFSDILRTNLLSAYGGVWIDATCFLTANIFEDIIPEFYSVKLSHNEEEKCVSEGKWCVFFMSASPNNILFNFLKDFYNEYWKKEDTIIDYFLMDYIISIAYDNIDKVKNMIDRVPENNILIHNLKEKLNNEYNNNEYENILEKNKIHKLAHEKKYIKRLSNGKETFYGYISKDFT